MKTIWSWICGIFRTVLGAAKNTAAKQVTDPANWRKALEIAKMLMDSGLSNADRREQFNAEMKSWAKSVGKTLAESAGSAKAVNLVLLGTLSRSFPFSEEEWMDAIEQSVPAKFLEMNKKAFLLGRGR